MYGAPVKAKTPAKVQPAERPKQAVLLAPNAAAAEALNKPVQPGPKPSGRVVVRVALFPCPRISSVTDRVCVCVCVALCACL